MNFWEAQWAPYDEGTYAAVLSHLRDEDLVLDIGAGDLRLARRMAERVRKVYAIEIQARLLNEGGGWVEQRPNHLELICADARTYPFPMGITVGVLLMRHCRHWSLYWEKLRAAGCRRLITNARWGMGVECVELDSIRRPYQHLALGWYACVCGTTGFVPGPAEELTAALLDAVQEVDGCPTCL